MAPHPQRLTVTRRAWPLAGASTAPDGAKPMTEVLLAELYDGNARGRGECVPLARYGETVDSVLAALEAIKPAVLSGLNRDTLQHAMPPGAARNALDCAFWDIDAKRTYRSAEDLAGLDPVPPLVTAFNLACDNPEKMAEQATAHRARPLLKVNLGGDGDIERVQAVRHAAPTARLIVDAHEAWTVAQLNTFMPILADLRVELIEQPLPAAADTALAGLAHPIPLCADESCRTLADLDRLVGTYAMIAVNLDKVGGLTEALALAAQAKRRGLRIMVSGSTSTSLGVAPALLVAQHAAIVDLDGPLHLAIDRGAALRYAGSTIQPPDPNLWGGPG